MQHRAILRSILLAVSLGLVSNNYFCDGQEAKYSAEWLASALDMNTADKANEALGLNSLSQQQSPKLQAKPVDRNSYDMKRSSYIMQVESGQYSEALGVINKLIADAAVMPEDVPDLETIYLIFDKLQVLKRANRSVEALIESQKLLGRMKKLQMCHPKSSQINLCLSLNKFISQTDAELSIQNDYQKLQLNYGASSSDIRKSYRNLMLILHPDKYSELDEAGEAYVYDLYFKVKASYEALMRQ